MDTKNLTRGEFVVMGSKIQRLFLEKLYALYWVEKKG